MNRTAIAVSVCIGMMPSAALALDWSLKSSQIETIELNDNQFLRTSPAPSVGSYSTITANAEARTPTSTFNFDADGNFRKFWGPGAEGAPTESLSHGFAARYEQKEKTGSEYLTAIWRQSSTSFALLGELGVVTPTRGFLDSLTFSGGIDRSLSALDTVSLSARSTRVTYEPSSGGTPLTDTSARGSWRHKLSSVTAINVSSDVELLDFENATNTHIQIYRNQVGFDSTLSPVLSLRGNIGAIYILTEGGSNPLATAGTSPLNGSTSSGLVDWIGDAVLTYRVLKNTTLAVTASQSVSSSVVGSLSKRDSITASLNHTINSKSSLSFSGSFTRSITTVTSDFASASVTYGYTIMPSLTAQLTYRHSHRFASTGGGSIIDPITGTPTVSGSTPASSNSIMLVISHNYTVLPRGN